MIADLLLFVALALAVTGALVGTLRAVGATRDEESE